MKPALFYEPKDELAVRCTLCPHFCKIADGARGLCGVRENRGGTLYSLVYGLAAAVHVDPIEKKPLFHVHPGSLSFSMATVGCNFACQFCQNYQISQMPCGPAGRIAGESLSAKQIVQMALRNQCKTIACTYTEPTIYFEYAYDIAREAQEHGLQTIFVTNGYINPKPLQQIAPFLTAANVDLKGWDEQFYRKMVGGKLKSVLNALRWYKKLGIWLEVTTLVVPGYVDNETTLREIALFIKNELGPETPWHVSRFYPNYHCDHLPITSAGILRRAREIGLEVGLRYVYSGNIPGDFGEHTVCYSCRKILIERYGFQILHNHIHQNACSFCHASIDGIGMSED